MSHQVILTICCWWNLCHSGLQNRPTDVDVCDRKKLHFDNSRSQLGSCFSLRQFSMECSLSGGIRVRIPQKLDVVAFWSWNLDFMVFQSWNLDVVAFRLLKKCLGITMSWLNCLCFSMSWCLSPRISVSRFFGLGISMSWFFGLEISMSWDMCLHGLVFVFIVKTEKPHKNILNYVKEYFNYPNLCNSYQYKGWISELE